MDKEPTFKAGVLIIGSLFWDNTNGRRPWREHYFGENFNQHIITVEVPVRYGRYSGLRDCPTMVMSSKCQEEDKLGQGIFLPFQNQEQSIDEIICSARALSVAEGKSSSKFIKGAEQKWCVITYMSNPALTTTGRLSTFSEKWKTQYDPKVATIKEQFTCDCETVTIFDDHGRLNINWPEKLNDFDVILATQTRPTDCYSPTSLASAFFKKPEYFLKNRLNHIHTPDDEHILTELKILVSKERTAFEKNAASNNCSPVKIADFAQHHLKLA